MRDKLSSGIGLRALLAGLFAGVAIVGCSGIDAEAPVQVSCPPSDRINFGSVSKVLELRCGTLDCHGNTYRPLRIYGKDTLRRPEEPDSPNVPAGEYDQYYPGGAVNTTDAELLDNARSMCGLEPEKTALVLSGDAEPETLTVVRKARLEEKHKGGPIWGPGDLGDQCIINWLQGPPKGSNTVNTAPCDQEANR